MHGRRLLIVSTGNRTDWSLFDSKYRAYAVMYLLIAQRCGLNAKVVVVNRLPFHNDKIDGIIIISKSS